MVRSLAEGLNMATGKTRLPPRWFVVAAWHAHRRIRREVVGRAASGEERARLWGRWRQLDARLDDFTARRPNETAIVVFEPRAVAD
jgi:hypothetical protein